MLQCNAGNSCLGFGNSTPSYMAAVQPGSLFSLISSGYLPLAEDPYPFLNNSDVVEPPLPPVTRAPTPMPAGSNSTAYGYSIIEHPTSKAARRN